MTKKLTLSVSEDVIIRAKEYAKKSGRSLSEIVESYLDKVTTYENPQSDISDLNAIYGIISGVTETDDNKLLLEALEERHQND